MDEQLRRLGHQRKKYDIAVYTSWKREELQDQTLPHVEDPLYGESDLSHKKGINSFMETSTMGSKKDTDSVYVSWRMKRSRHGIAVNQDNYIKEVDNADADAYNYRDGMKVLKENEQSHFRKLVGIIKWLATNKGPDLM